MTIQVYPEHHVYLAKTPGQVAIKTIQQEIGAEQEQSSSRKGSACDKGACQKTQTKVSDKVWCKEENGPAQQPLVLRRFPWTASGSMLFNKARTHWPWTQLSRDVGQGEKHSAHAACLLADNGGIVPTDAGCVRYGAARRARVLHQETEVRWAPNLCLL